MGTGLKYDIIVKEQIVLRCIHVKFVNFVGKLYCNEIHVTKKIGTSDKSPVKNLWEEISLFR